MVVVIDAIPGCGVAMLPQKDVDSLAWVPPSHYVDVIRNKEERDAVLYGRELIANTAYYLGPNGVVAQTTNGMNCQNCHLDAGTRANGINYSAVQSTYPRFRERSGTIENIYKRVSDCFERSLNGIAPDSSSKEFLAIQAYIQWLGKNVRKGTIPTGAGLPKLALLDRPASSENGKQVYVAVCATCHGMDGAGQPSGVGRGYQYPPLWGSASYSTAAGLYRISNFASFVYHNMPYAEKGQHKTILTPEQAWDVAAFVNSQTRPVKPTPQDWPDISKKPFDHPLGPYVDSFSEQQHKYGPFGPIKAFQLTKQ